LIPFASVGDSSYSAPQGTVVDAETLPPVKQMEELSTEQFINILSVLLTEQQPASYDQDLLDRMAAIGIEAGEPFELPTDNFILNQKLKAIPSIVHKRMRKRKANPDPALMKNNWTIITSKLGDYKDDYLDGSKSYIIHMDSSALPPVKAFWSLTAYNPDDFLIDHGYDRYAINSNDSLHYNDDGSLDIRIQSQAPSEQSTENWLPVKNDEEFSLTMRLYWPTDAVLKGKWAPPSVRSKK